MLGTEDAFEIEVKTSFGRATIFHAIDTHGDTVRVLEVGGTYESATYLDERYCDLAFEYTELFNHAFELGRDIRRVLVLGGGGFSWPKHLIAYHPEISVDVVEIDAGMIRIAREYFGLDELERQYHAESEGRLRIFCEDALGFLLTHDDTYDLIVNDCFVGMEAPKELADWRATGIYRSHLNAGGVFFANVVAALMGRRSQNLRDLVRLLSARFKHVGVVPLGSDDLKVPDNNLVVASDEPFVLRDGWNIKWLLD